MPFAAQRQRSRMDTQAKGWDGIQSYMLSHDEDMIGDFADDIDTLLVFAGLFSAVLTAFVVGSILLLQPDNSQVSVQLLSLMALQLGAPEDLRPVLNSTASSVAQSLGPFSPSSSSVAINTLWFFSLVFSLAAALFGIVAKQWCREYLKWHSALTPARDNVLLRQMRYNAWQEWRVASYIASIPALLETALILFLVGIVIFVWTLDRILAILVTLVIGIILSIAFAITLLPVFARLCPYRSPTGWAFVLLAHLLRISRRTAVMAHYGATVQETWESWRTRDFDLATYPDSPRPTFNACWDSDVTQEQSARDAFQTLWLMRALSWVRRSSDDPVVVERISDAVSSLHSLRNCGLFGPSPHSVVYVLCQFAQSSRYPFPFTQRIQVTYMQAFKLTGFPRLRKHFALVHHPRLRERFARLVCPNAEQSVDLGDKITLSILRQLLISDLEAMTLLMVDGNSHGTLEEQTATVLCLLYVVVCLSDLTTDFTGLKNTGNALKAVFAQLAPHTDTYECGVASMVLDLIFILCGESLAPKDGWMVVWDVEFIGSQAKHLEGARRLPEYWATHAVRLWNATDGYRDGHAGRRTLFVMAATSVFRVLKLNVECPLRIPLTDRGDNAWLAAMVTAARLSLAHEYRDCGGHVELPWLSSILELYQTMDPLTGAVVRPEKIMLTDPARPRVKATFLLLLSALQENILAGLISGGRVQETLDRILEILGHPELPEVDHRRHGRQSEADSFSLPSSPSSSSLSPASRAPPNRGGSGDRQAPHSRSSVIISPVPSPEASDNRHHNSSSGAPATLPPGADSPRKAEGSAGATYVESLTATLRAQEVAEAAPAGFPDQIRSSVPNLFTPLQAPVNSERHTDSNSTAPSASLTLLDVGSPTDLPRPIQGRQGTSHAASLTVVPLDPSHQDATESTHASVAIPSYDIPVILHPLLSSHSLLDAGHHEQPSSALSASLADSEPWRVGQAEGDRGILHADISARESESSPEQDVEDISPTFLNHDDPGSQLSQTPSSSARHDATFSDPPASLADIETVTPQRTEGDTKAAHAESSTAPSQRSGSHDTGRHTNELAPRHSVDDTPTSPQSRRGVEDQRTPSHISLVQVSSGVQSDEEMREGHEERDLEVGGTMAETDDVV